MTASVQIKKDRPNYYIVIAYKEASKNKTKWISTDIPVKGNNKRKVEALRVEVLAQYLKENVDLGKDTLFVDFMNGWLENLRHNIEASTYGSYKHILDQRIIPYFEQLKLKVRDIEPSHIQQFIDHYMKTISGNTVRKYLANISKCLDSAVRQNIIAYNPVKRIEQPKKVKYNGAKFYNEKQIEQLLSISKGDPLEIVILLTVFYGLRRSEVLGLKWTAIDFNNNTIAIRHTVVQGFQCQYRKDSTKNESSNTTLPLALMIANRLKQWKAQQLEHKILQPNDYIDEGYICTQTDGSLILPNYVSHHFSLLLAKNGMPHIRFHDLRHSSASYLKYLGFDLKDIQTWLRHADIQTSMDLYTHLDMSAKVGIADRLNDRITDLIAKTF